MPGLRKEEGREVRGRTGKESEKRGKRKEKRPYL